jgi:hypothetical protein
LGVTAAPSLLGWVRRIYPRELDARDLVRDLGGCGVVIENVDRLLDLCATNRQPWAETFVQMATEGRKIGIRFFWRNDENKDGIGHTVEAYPFGPELVDTLLRHILTSDGPAS